MTTVFEKITVDANGNITSCEHVQAVTLRVMSDEIMPKGCGRGTEAFIIDKCAAAFCDGNDTWYGTGGRSAKAGQPWSVLLG